MPIIMSDAAKHSAPSAASGVGSRATSALHAIAASTPTYSDTGTASVPRLGQKRPSMVPATPSRAPHAISRCGRRSPASGTSSRR
ncbi:hypothetical protein D9M72_380900 [compost metagenome]